MKRKYKVFISSSFTDLDKARLRLHLKTLKLGHIPAGMELFQPGETRNLEVIEEEIATSDIFVVLVGARLGSEVWEGIPTTFTMVEFELAKKHELPIIAFLLHESEFKAERDRIPSERQHERDQEHFLQQFRNDVQVRDRGGKRIAGFFSYNNIDELCDKYADALRGEADRLTATGSGGGWIEGKFYDELSARIVLGESANGNLFFQRFAKRLSNFGKLSKRTAIESASKSAIANYFWEQYMPRIHHKGINCIYFESGSSIAYVSRSFIEYVREEDWFYEFGLDSKLKLRTNNILTYLEFFLIEPPWRPMDIQLQPHGPFSHDYGATYGRLKSTPKISSPRNSTEKRKIPPEAAKQVDNFVRELGKHFAHSGLVLMTTSGIDIDPRSAFQGPHVGSPYNMLLKRCLLSLQCPKVMFLDEKKWDYPFRCNNCHPVCDGDLTWNQVKTESPLAIAMAVSHKERRDALSESLAANGFGNQELGEVALGENSVWPIIASNQPFADYFQ